MIRPIGDKVIVRVDMAPEMEGMIHLVHNRSEDGETWEPTYGVVVSAGDGSCDACVGDRVAYDPWMGVEFEHEGIEYRLLEGRDVLAVLEEV